MVGNLPTHIYATCEIFSGGGGGYVWSESTRGLLNNGEHVWVLSVLESVQTDCLRLLRSARGTPCENILPWAAVYTASELVWVHNV